MHQACEKVMINSFKFKFMVYIYGTCSANETKHKVWKFYCQYVEFVRSLKGFVNFTLIVVESEIRNLISNLWCQIKTLIINVSVVYLILIDGSSRQVNVCMKNYALNVLNM